MCESTWIPLTTFMRHFTLGLINQARTMLKVLLALRVPKGGLLSCGCDMLHGAGGIVYLVLCPSMMKNFHTLLLEEGMYHLYILFHLILHQQAHDHS